MKLHTLLLLGLTAGFVGCSAKESAAPEDAAESEPAAPAVESELTTTQTEDWRSSDFLEHMHEHAEFIDELNFALVDGDLDRAKMQAYWLSRHETVNGLPEDLQPSLVRMREAAGAVEEADNLESARDSAQHIIAECQACHDAAGVVTE